MTDAYKNLSQEDALKLVEERDQELLAQKKELKSSNRLFWLMFGLVNISTILSIVGRNVGEAHNERRVFGENTSLTGNVIRWKFLLACNDCKNVDELLAASDRNPTHKAAGDALRTIAKDPMGKMMIDQVRARNVIFDSNPEHFRTACSAGATYTPIYGVINYDTGLPTLDKEPNLLAHVFRHEMIHALQNLEVNFFKDHKKNEVIHHYVTEAAAYVLTPFMEKRSAWIDANPGKDIAPVSDADIDDLKKKMRKFLITDSGRFMRQYYMLKFDLTVKDYERRAEKLNIAALQKTALLPDGRSFYPEDLTPALLDLQVRKDFHQDVTQRKPRGVEKKASGNTHTEETAASEKSDSQKAIDTTCAARIQNLDDRAKRKPNAADLK